jgi:hypothetical protein
MCEETKCIHHTKTGGCKQGLKMTCTRRMKKLGLKIDRVNLKEESNPLWGTLEMF